MSSVVDATWRDAIANACESQADAIADCLAHIENVGQMLDDRHELTAAGRAYAGYLRTAANDLLSEARTLRAKGGEV